MNSGSPEPVPNRFVPNEDFRQNVAGTLGNDVASELMQRMHAEASRETLRKPIDPRGARRLLGALFRDRKDLND